MVYEEELSTARAPLWLLVGMHLTQVHTPLNRSLICLSASVLVLGILASLAGPTSAKPGHMLLDYYKELQAERREDSLYEKCRHRYIPQCDYLKDYDRSSRYQRFGNDASSLRIDFQVACVSMMLITLVNGINARVF
eukprot:maker-scaffold254_size236139-snap-gene-1.14 protein:Tk02054 transcript:maker-scaffold254_size236139-snap-gene-1.14-mRNA-1 annotation:"peptide chain release factor 3"